MDRYSFICVLLDPLVGVEQLFYGVMWRCITKLGCGWPASVTQGFKCILCENENDGMQIS